MQKNNRVGPRDRVFNLSACFFIKHPSDYDVLELLEYMAPKRSFSKVKSLNSMFLCAVSKGLYNTNWAVFTDLVPRLSGLLLWKYQLMLCLQFSSSSADIFIHISKHHLPPFNLETLSICKCFSLAIVFQELILNCVQRFMYKDIIHSIFCNINYFKT